jgi:GTP-binding protein HflX
VDRREIDRRMVYLRRELEQVRRQRAQQRRRRRRAGIPVIAIVGYTNAGKSTLLNRLSGADVLVADNLFATLDPTTRKVSLPSGKEVLFTDTVGFIQKLPTQLVAAFRATLEEVQEADILLHVADISDPNLVSQIEAVHQVLRELDAADKPMIVALNKVDLVDPETDLADSGGLAMRRSLLVELSERYRQVVPISAQQGVGLEELLTAVEHTLAEQMVEIELVLPYDAGDLLDLWHKQGVVENTTYKQAGIRVRGKLPKWVVGVMTEHSPIGHRPVKE